MLQNGTNIYRRHEMNIKSGSLKDKDYYNLKLYKVLIARNQKENINLCVFKIKTLPVDVCRANITHACRYTFQRSPFLLFA